MSSVVEQGSNILRTYNTYILFILIIPRSDYRRILALGISGSKHALAHLLAILCPSPQPESMTFEDYVNTGNNVQTDEQLTEI